MNKEELENKLRDSLEVATLWVYLTIIPVFIFGLVLSIPIMIWKFAVNVADICELWFIYRHKNKQP